MSRRDDHHSKITTSLMSLLGVSFLSLMLSLSASLSAQPAPSTATAPSKHAISVEGEEVDLAAFNEAFALRRAKYRSATLSDKQRDQVSFLAAQPFVEQLLLKRALHKRGLTLDTTKVAKRAESIKRGMKSEEAFERYLQRISQTPKSFELQQWAKEAAFLVLQHDGALKVTEADLAEKKAQVSDKLHVPEKVRAQLLSRELNPKATPEQVNKAFQEIQAAHALVLKGDLPFEVLIQQHSNGPLRGRKGDLGFVSRGDLEPAVERALWSLKEGEVSAPVRSALGWHLVKRRETIPAYTRSLEELLPNVKERVMQIKFHKALQPFMRALWRTYKVEASFTLPPAYRAK